MSTIITDPTYYYKGQGTKASIGLATVTCIANNENFKLNQTVIIGNTVVEKIPICSQGLISLTPWVL
jgi:hypothetical protein